jgi:hypothetical protein
MILYAMLFLGVYCCTIFMLLKAINWHFWNLVFILFIAFCAILMLSQGIGRSCFVENKYAPSSGYTINYCGLQTISSFFGNKPNASTTQCLLWSVWFSDYQRTLTLIINIWITFKGYCYLCFCYAFVYKLRLAKSKNYLYFSVHFVLLCLSNWKYFGLLI